MIPGITLPYLDSALGVMNLLIFVTSHVPHHKVNVIGVSIGLEASFRRGKTIQGFAQSVQIFVQPPLHDFFEVHVFPLVGGPSPVGLQGHAYHVACRRREDSPHWLSPPASRAPAPSSQRTAPSQHRPALAAGAESGDPPQWPRNARRPLAPRRSPA